MCGNTAHCSTQPRYRKVGHGFFFQSVHYRIALICGTAASETYIFIYTSICIVPNMVFTQILRRKQMLQQVPFSIIRSRHSFHTTSTQQQQQRQQQQQQQQQQQRYRGSSPLRGRLQGRRQDPEFKSSAVEAASSIVLTVSPPVSLSPLSSCFACPLCSYVVNFNGFPPFYEALL